VNESADAATLRFYGKEAEKYCERIGSAPTSTLEEFLGRLPRDATILELGCGSGRDSAEMLRRGYDVLLPMGRRKSRSRLSGSSIDP